jgi:hypothetical protein
VIAELEAYERFGVEEHVHDIIAELCKIPAACDEFGLGDGIPCEQIDGQVPLAPVERKINVAPALAPTVDIGRQTCSWPSICSQATQ